MSTSFGTRILETVAQTDGPYQLHSLKRAVAILGVLAESNTPLSLAEIYQRMGLHKSTVHRSLMVLECSDLIVRVHNNRFCLGLRLYDLGNRALEQIDFCTRIRPFLQRLSKEVGEMVQLGMMRQTSVVYLGRVEPNRKVRQGSKRGASNPVYCTALGKALLAFQSTETIEQIVSKIQFVQYTQNTAYSRDMLFKALERVRRDGYAIDDEEIEIGIRCVGAPILNGNRQSIAAVSVSGPASRIAARNVSAIAERLLRCCQDVSMSLGFPAQTSSLLPILRRK